MRRLARIAVAVTVSGGLLLAHRELAFAGNANGSCLTSSCGIAVSVPGAAAAAATQPDAQRGNNASQSSATSSGPCPAGQTATYAGISNASMAWPITGQAPPPGFTFESISCNGVYLESIQVAVGAAGPTAPPITGAQVAQQAVASFTIAGPVPELSPATAIVNFPTWLWIQSPWAPQTATATVAGLSATVTATPTTVTWDMGDNTPTTCNGPGTPYNPDIADADQHTDCSHTYQKTGTLTATVTVSYTTAWTATDGTTGQLGTVTGTTNFPVTINEIEAVNTT